MMLRLLFSFFILGLTIAKAVKTDARFVQDYFKERGIRQIAAFGCWHPSEMLEVFHNLASPDTKLSLTPISDRLVMRERLKVNYYKLGVLYHLDCANSDIIILDQTSHGDGWRFFNESYLWLMVSSSTTSGVTALLERLPLSIDAELTLALRQPDREEGYELYDVYNPSYRHHGKLNITHMGSWDFLSAEKDSPRGFRNELTQYKYRRRGDLAGMHLNFSIVLDFLPKASDYSTMKYYLSNPVDRHLDTMHRYNYALTLQLRDYYNFTMNLMRGSTWGYLINGTFNGIVGDMIKGVVDVGATPFQFKPERMDVMDYTVQAYVARACIIFRHPKRHELKNSFLEPFSQQVWWLTVLVGLLNWLLLYGTVRLEKDCKLRRQLDFGSNAYGSSSSSNTLFAEPASETFLITSAAICQQGLSDTPSMYSGRIVYMSLFVWAMLLYQFYSASIVGSLLAEKPRFIRSVKDLADSSLEVGIEDMPYNHDFFRTTTDENVIELYERKIAPNKRRKTPPYYSAEDGLRKVQKGDFAFQVDSATAYKIITDTFSEDEICDLQEIELFGPKHTATCTSKHSPFKKMITYGLRQVVEHGMTRRLEAVWKPRKPICPESHSSTPSPVTLNEFSPVLVMIAAAFFLSVFLMLLENLLRKLILQKYASSPGFLARHSAGRKIPSPRDEESLKENDAEKL